MTEESESNGDSEIEVGGGSKSILSGESISPKKNLLDARRASKRLFKNLNSSKLTKTNSQDLRKSVFKLKPALSEKRISTNGDCVEEDIGKTTTPNKSKFIQY